jgi:hypothetical protein
MNKIMELRNKRNTLWEQTKNFLEEHRGDNGLVEASAVELYNKMAADVQPRRGDSASGGAGGFDAQLSQPTPHPVTNKPMSRKAENVAPTATDEYAGAFWNLIRNRRSVRGSQCPVCGRGHEGGYTVPTSSSASSFRPWRRITSSVSWRRSSALTAATASSHRQRHHGGAVDR